MSSHENTAPKTNLLTLLVFVSLLLTLVAVVLSAYFRLRTMGLSCPEWPACFGRILPAERPPGAPGDLLGVAHRLAAALLGLLVLGIALIALRWRGPGGPGRTLPLLVLGLTVFLSVLGYSTPTLQVPAVALGNLGGGMAMLALLWWIGQRLVPETDGGIPPGGANLRPWALGGLGVLALQILLGAWTSASFAGPACPGLPGCGAGWASWDGFARGFNIFRVLELDGQDRILPDMSQATVHMVHRLGAVLTFIYIGMVALKARGLGGRFRLTGTTLLVLLALQAGAGVTAVLTQLPLLLVTAHNAIAALLLLAAVNLVHLLTPRAEAKTA